LIWPSPEQVHEADDEQIREWVRELPSPTSVFEADTQLLLMDRFFDIGCYNPEI
jgi:hypothetical protein